MMLLITLKLKVLNLNLNIHIPDKTELVNIYLMILNLKIPVILMYHKTMLLNYKPPLL